MIVSWNWLKEYVTLDMSVDALVDRLLMSGLNHESTEDVDGDIAIDLEVTSNRPDCLGQLGIAREIAVLHGRELKMPRTDFAESATAIDSKTSVSIEAEAATWCPQYRARLIEGVKIAPSPHWMQLRLRSLGLTPINNIVDITNYVLFECGQPLHAFDFDKLIDKKIVVRNARPGEKFRAINNRDYELAASMGVIADGKNAVALAGVMGGSTSEVSDSTVNILLETAEFAPLSIRKTSRAIDLSSDSSYRFERKIDPLGVAWASDRACHLIAELAGGKVAKGFIHAGAKEFPREPVSLRWLRVERILGIQVAKDEIKRILTVLGLKAVSENSESIAFLPPTFRRDLTREIDLIEEIGRIHGYAEVRGDRTIPLAVAPRTKSDRVIDKVRDQLGAGGYCEAITFSFCDAKTATAVRPWTTVEPLAVRHSSRKQENQLRQSLIPSLLHAVRLNEARGNEKVSLFEIAQIFLPRADQQLPNEPRVIGVASMKDFRDVRGDLETLFDRLRLPVVLVPAPVVGMEAGRSAELQLNGAKIGVIGQIAASVRDAYDLRTEVVAAELLSEPLIEFARLIPRAAPIPDQPAIVRDLAVVLDEKTRWANLESIVRRSAGPTLESLEFVDLYRGKQVDKGKKSIAFRLTYRATDRTLTRDEVEGYQQKVVEAIAAEVEGKLRQ